MTKDEIYEWKQYLYPSDHCKEGEGRGGRGGGRVSVRNDVNCSA